MKIAITGTKSLSEALYNHLSRTHLVQCLGRDCDINKANEWCLLYKDIDCIINCAYSGFAQVQVLDAFSAMWRDDASKYIINIGSTVSDYTRSERELDAQYFPYRIHKQALQNSFNALAKDVKCNIKLLNSGPFESNMVSHLTQNKLSLQDICNYTDLLINDPNLKRLDVWR